MNDAAPAPIDALRTLPRGTAVVVHANHPPARIRLRPFHEEKQWKTLGGWLDPACPYR